MKKLIIISVLLTGCMKQTNQTPPEPFKYSGYETDNGNYYNGQILPPDYVHLDTLMVIDADLLNEGISNPYFLGSDSDINDLLTVTTKKYKSQE